MPFGTVATPVRVAELQSAFLRRVYNWMGLGLALTGLVAYYTASNPALLGLVVGNQLIFFALIIGQLGLVVALSAAINRLSPATATALFFLYAGLTGLTLSVIFVAYTQSSITNAFVVTAGTFALTSLYGYTTKRDLTSWGSFFFMGLVGIILASLVNFFLQSETIYWVTTYIGVFVFVGLTAYDTQYLKNLAGADFADEGMESRAAVVGALKLYLDFINLFLLLLRIMGGRRE
ncbi:MAG: Bax inhibitor-1/YccA family protein [Desulfobacca sp.]|uniref:Bax inhibitor-1/YccA family protein n=1 Tax=Desulfobacca sp. TaxID=2067990 RepID=UPI004049B769